MSSKIPVAISFTGSANLLGVVGIIGSLIFVAIDLRQSQRIALAAQQQARMEVFANFMNSLTEAGISYQEIMDFNMSPDTKAAIYNGAHLGWFVFENDLLQYELGLIEEDIWQAKLNAMEVTYNRCGIRDAYESRKGMLSEGLNKLVADVPDRCAE